jgi:hypothetical protein
VLICGYVAQPTLTNFGTIIGAAGVQSTPGFAVAAVAGAGVRMQVQAASGVGSDGVVLGQYGAGDVLINAGTIGGGAGAGGAAAGNAVYIGSYGGTLLVDPGAVFMGNVVAAAGNGTLVLSGTTAGSLDLSDPITGFSNIIFSPGSDWTLTGTSAELAQGETIIGFAAGDRIALTDFMASSASYVSGTGLVLSDGTMSETINVIGSFASTGFTVTNGEVVANALCFARGTRIATPGRQVAVEQLKVGDIVLTTGGPEAVRWIGRRSYEGRFIAGNHLALPVTIKRHAIAKDVPSRDLTVSPGHGIFVAGVLVSAWRLINGVSVTQAASVELVEYFHVELARHCVMLAENCPAESFFDNGDRGQFHNADEAPVALDGVALPRCEEGFALERVRARVAARAGILPGQAGLGRLMGYLEEAGPERVVGWAVDTAAPDVPVVLDVLVNGLAVMQVVANGYRDDVRKAGYGAGCNGFAFALPVRGRVSVRRHADGAGLAWAVRAA